MPLKSYYLGICILYRSLFLALVSDVLLPQLGTHTMLRTFTVGFLCLDKPREFLVGIAQASRPSDMV
jgi:hypothetical protein